ncbi:MAG: hypothetical protein M1826_003457 [Phylliscum demangeonii]|nr:MAG: hypothetical protein M1826_003457 [Phylliscum demangeonii]
MSGGQPQLVPPMEAITPNKVSISSDAPSASPRGSNSGSATTLRGDGFDREHLLDDDWEPSTARNKKKKTRQEPGATESTLPPKDNESLLYRKVLKSMTITPPLNPSATSSSPPHPAIDGIPILAADTAAAAIFPSPSSSSSSSVSARSPLAPFDQEEPEWPVGPSLLPPWQRFLQCIGVRKSAAGTVRMRKARHIFGLHDPGVASLLENLMLRFGRSTHDVLFDASYRIYLAADREAAICFKRYKNVAVAYGDPCCDARQITDVFDTFRLFCKQHGWKVAVVGAGPALAEHARVRGWGSWHFGLEQVMDPMTNAVLDERAAKTITRGNRRLFQSGVRLGLYDPRRGRCPDLELELSQVYHGWRAARFADHAPQTYATVLDPFALPSVSRHLYTTAPNGRINGMASLVRLGAWDGYLLEPCIATPDAPKGITEFLATMALGLLRDEGVDYMTFGLAPMPELGHMIGMPSALAHTVRAAYRTTFNALSLGGKKIFHEKFKPEDGQRVSLYMLFPPGFPLVNGTRAVLDVNHISLREVWRLTNAADATSGASSPSSSTLASASASASTPFLQRDDASDWDRSEAPSTVDLARKRARAVEKEVDESRRPTRPTRPTGPTERSPPTEPTPTAPIGLAEEPAAVGPPPSKNALRRQRKRAAIAAAAAAAAAAGETLPASAPRADALCGLGKQEGVSVVVTQVAS